MLVEPGVAAEMRIGLPLELPTWFGRGGMRSDLSVCSEAVDWLPSAIDIALP